MPLTRRMPRWSSTGGGRVPRCALLFLPQPELQLAAPAGRRCNGAWHLSSHSLYALARDTNCMAPWAPRLPCVLVVDATHARQVQTTGAGPQSTLCPTGPLWWPGHVVLRRTPNSLAHTVKQNRAHTYTHLPHCCKRHALQRAQNSGQHGVAPRSDFQCLCPRCGVGNVSAGIKRDLPACTSCTAAAPNCKQSLIHSKFQ